MGRGLPVGDIGIFRAILFLKKRLISLIILSLLFLSVSFSKITIYDGFHDIFSSN